MSKTRNSVKKRGPKQRHPSQPPDADVALRVPQQTRSRERVARILSTCRALIAETDPMAVTMAEVARRAGIPIGSLYQYFPTKAALIGRLFEERLEEHRNLTKKRLAEISSPSDCAPAVRDLHMQIYRANRQDMFLRDIWAGSQASRETRDIHVRDNEFYSQLWYEMARRAEASLPSDTLHLRAIAVNELWDGAIRLAITLPKAQGDALMSESLNIGLLALGMT